MKTIIGLFKRLISQVNQVKTLQMKPLDFALILILMLASFTPFFLFKGTQHHGSTAQLRVNSKVIKTFDLTKNQKYTYTEEDGDINLIEVRDGRIAIVYANCPDQICVRKGFISKTGQTIVCLPHRLVIEVMSSADDDENEDRIIDY
ncbi:MAG: NusG domain II-containing protein [Streptococcaceae bacterium]|nr:NusG domain II-containing protein [Streptococcaceae bacterium]